MKLDLKSKKGRLILFGSIATVAAVATAIAVPVALLVPKSATPLTPLEQEVADFNKVYKNALSISTSAHTGGSIVTVNREAFLNRSDLPAGFTLPSVVTAVAANAFKGAKLPSGFTIPTGVASIDATAFEDVVFDEDLYWNNSKVEAGAAVDTVENNKEWKDFVALYPNTLSGKGVVADAFKGRLDLPADFVLPSFLTKIGARAFLSSKFPSGFQLPASIASIGEYALAEQNLPDGFVIPKTAMLSDNSFANTVFPKNFALPDEMTAVGFEGNAVSGKAIRPFYGATFNENFTIKNTVTAVSSGAFYNAKLPLDFMIPTATKLYSLATDGSWVSDSNVKLSDSILPDDAKWSVADGAVPGAIVVAYPPADQVSDFNSLHNNALIVSGSTITVKDGAFLNSSDLPAGFRLPTSVTAIAANAFKGAKLPLGFKIPQGVTSIDATSFADLAFDDNLFWNNSKAEAGARVDTVENNTEWKAFTALYPNTLRNKSVVDDAFTSRTFPSDFVLPSFLTKIGKRAFWDTKLPTGFSFPSSVSYISEFAFGKATIPSQFVFPVNARFEDYVFNEAVFPQNFAFPDALTAIGFEANDISGPSLSIFSEATFAVGFTLKATVKGVAYQAFIKAKLPLGFEIPASTGIYGFLGDGKWVDQPGLALQQVMFLSPNSKWNLSGGAVSGSKIVPDTDTAGA